MIEGWKPEGKLLNRVVRGDARGWRLEADPRHAELVVEQLDDGNLKPAVTPGVEGQEELDRDDDVDITGADATRFRGAAARCNYMAFDRPDMQYATKEVCREMAKPTTGSLRRLRRIGQYLKKKPRLVWNFDMQCKSDILNVYTDSNWASCRRSCKSTSGGTVMIGNHCLKAWSKTQALVAKSSAEAELYGVVRGATEALGLSTLFSDFGMQVKLKLHVDAAAAKGIRERRGISKVRHLDVNVLWLQETAARRDMPVLKVPGEIHPADLATKHLCSAKIDNMVSIMNLSFESGRPDIAANLHSLGGKHVDNNNDMDNLKNAMLSLDNGSSVGSWHNIRRAGNRLKGGDRWHHRGGAGAWERWHLTPRRVLFTPYNVAKGPAKSIDLIETRFTCGITKSGRQFERLDNWKQGDKRHLDLGEDWVGYSVFLEEGYTNTSFQFQRDAAKVPDRRVLWVDPDDE